MVVYEFGDAPRCTDPDGATVGRHCWHQFGHTRRLCCVCGVAERHHVEVLPVPGSSRQEWAAVAYEGDVVTPFPHLAK